MKRFSPNKNGVTLIEQVVTILLIGILIVSSSGMIIGAMRILGRNMITINAQERGIAVMRQLENHLKYANAVVNLDTDPAYTACPYRTILTVKESSGEYTLEAEVMFDQFSDNNDVTGSNVLCDLGGFKPEYTITLTDNTKVEIYLNIKRNDTIYYSEKRIIDFKNAPSVTAGTIDQSENLYIGSME